MACHLAQHARACICQDHLVFLDLSHDRYFGVRLGQAHTPPSCRLNIPSSSSCALDAIFAKRSLVEALEHRALLAADAESGDRCGMVQGLAGAKATFPSPELPILPSPAIALRFFAAARCAARLIATASMARIVDRVRQRKKQISAIETDSAVDKAARLIGSFHTLRPLYPRSYLCLFDSLAMIEFLNRFGLFPTWVFDVAVHPFRAQCWLQQGELVLDDHIETVRRYTPIMAV